MFQKLLQYRRYLLLPAGVAAVLLLLLLLPVLLPFGIGLAIACGARALARRVMPRVNRTFSACLWVALLLLALLGISALAVLRLVRAVGEVAQELPLLLERAAPAAAAVKQALLSFGARLPDGVGEAVRSWTESLFSDGSSLVRGFTEKVVALASALLSAMPDVLLFLLTAVISAFCFAASLPALRRAAVRAVPPQWSRKVRGCLVVLRRTLGSWCRAQLQLIGVTFCILTIGLWILRYRSAPLLAAAIALVDALPVLGVGSVLIPWAMVQFLRGEMQRGVGLLLLWGAASLTRTALEPKIMGRQLGMPAVVTLFAMYAGYRFFSIPGMLLFPVFSILLRQFYLLSK